MTSDDLMPRRISSLGSESLPTEIDTSKAHPARMYDYFLGGKDNFPVDRQTAESSLRAWPGARVAARENREFLGRAVRYIVNQGVSQFLDIGTGIPTAGNTHQVAQENNPEAGVVYVDNDPIVLVHARALLRSAQAGRNTAYIEADVRDPEYILSEARALLDFTKPIGLMLIAILHFVGDEDDPIGIVRTLLDALPTGSYLALTHLTDEFDAGPVNGLIDTYTAAGVTCVARDSDRMEEFFNGLRLIRPGIVPVQEWQPADDSPRPPAAEVAVNGGVGLKP